MTEPVSVAWASALRLFCEWLRDLKEDIANMMPAAERDDDHADQ